MVIPNMPTNEDIIVADIPSFSTPKITPDLEPISFDHTT